MTEKDYKVNEQLKLAGKWIEESKSILFVTGAGISVSCGIPDFRSEGSGIYSNLQQYNLRHPQQMFHKQIYYLRPRPLYALLQDLIQPTKYPPSYTHSFQKLIEDMNKLEMVVTQNVDNIERDIGIYKIIQAHGCLTYYLKCTICGHIYSHQALNIIYTCIQDKAVPYCEVCGHVVKPDLIFFGDSMPDEIKHCPRHIAKCDLLIVMGTSLQTAPINQLPLIAKYQKKRRILINHELAPSFSFTDPNDCILLGDCDYMVQHLCQKLNVLQQLNEIHGKFGNSIQTHSLQPINNPYQSELILCAFQNSLIIPTSLIFQSKQYNRVMLAFVSVSYLQYLKTYCKSCVELDSAKFATYIDTKPYYSIYEYHLQKTLQQYKIIHIFDLYIKIQKFFGSKTAYAPLKCHYSSYVTQFLYLRELGDDKDIWDLITRHKKTIKRKGAKTRPFLLIQLFLNHKNRCYVNYEHLQYYLKGYNELHWDLKTVFAEL